MAASPTSISKAGDEPGIDYLTIIGILSALLSTVITCFIIYFIQKCFNRKTTLEKETAATVDKADNSDPPPRGNVDQIVVNMQIKEPKDAEDKVAVDDDEALARLIDMGYSPEYSNKALQQNNHDFQKALDWLFKHPQPPSKKSKKLIKPKKKYGNHRRMDSLLNMGFNEEESSNALKLHNNDVAAAIEYLITHPDAQHNSDDEFVLVNDEEEKKKDAEWQQITINDIKNHSISPWDMELQNEYESTLLSPFKLKQIIAQCPTRIHLYKWNLSYCTEKHGISINTLYHKLANIEDCILIINDANGGVFGAFIDCKWKKPKKKNKSEYSGTVDCFVFNYIENEDIEDTNKNELKVYHASGNKRYFFRNDLDSITIGAGEAPAIYFDMDFNFGRSVHCDTFNSPSLAANQQFKIKKLQIWAPIVVHQYSGE
eukprot:563849_1